jgi:hypothetical protein
MTAAAQSERSTIAALRHPVCEPSPLVRYMHPRDIGSARGDRPVTVALRPSRRGGERKRKK